MGIETITEKILAEAQNDARRIFEKGRYEGRDLIYQAERLIKQKKESMEQKAHADCETVKKRRRSVAELEARKMRLAAKQEAISRCFDEATEKLAELPEEEYIDLLVKTAESLDIKSGEILLNKRDRERIGEMLIERINRGTGKMTLSSDTVQCAGGFLLKKGSVEINSTLEVMVSSIRDEVMLQVAEILFGQKG